MEIKNKKVETKQKHEKIKTSRILDTGFITTVWEHELRRFRLSRLAKRTVFNTTFLKSLGVLVLLLTLTFGWKGNNLSKAGMNEELAERSFQISALAKQTGESVKLQASSLPSYRPVEFEITLPSGQVMVLTSTSDEDGKALTELSGINTGKAGVYLLEANSDNLVSPKPSSFVVKPGDPEPNISEIRFRENLLVADGKQEEKVTIILRDKFGNKIPERKVSLFSNRSSDLILRHENKTDEDGKISFGVRSFEPGISTLSALDEKSGVVFSSKKKLQFIAQETEDAIGGNDRMLFAAADEPVSGTFLYISVIDPEITVNMPFGIMVEAMNESAEPISSYTGTVHFISDNSGAVLPSDFTFTPENQGRKMFDFGVTFVNTGTGNIIAYDIVDNGIAGEINDILINPKTVGEQANTAPIITSPQDNSKTNQKSLKISGTADRDSRVVAYDGTKKIGESVATPAGVFDISVQNLTDDSHKFTALSTDTSGNISPISNAVEIIVDTMPPTPEKTQLSSKTAGAMEKVRLTVISEDNLTEAKAIVDKRAIVLNPSELAGNIYEAEFTTPQKAGDYPIDIVLTDEVGNTQTYRDQVSITVEGKLLPVELTEIIPGDESVFLSWKTVEGVKQYKVYYGKSGEVSQEFVLTGSAKTSGTITGLDNDSEYSFSVSALNEEEDESEISKTSQASVTPQFEFGEIDTTGMEGPETGPGLLFLLLGAIFAGTIAFRKRLMA